MAEENLMGDFEEEFDGSQVIPEAKASKEINLDDLSDVAERDKFFKVSKAMPIMDGQLFTIETVKINKPLTVDKDGKDLSLTNSKGNKYFKGRLEIRFKEMVEGMKIRDFIPGLYWSVNKEGAMQELPSISKASDNFEDQFTAELSKIRMLFCQFKKIDPKDLSDKQFLKGLVGSKVTVKKVTGKNPKENNKEWTKLKITNFVN